MKRWMLGMVLAAVVGCGETVGSLPSDAAMDAGGGSGDGAVTGEDRVTPTVDVPAVTDVPAAVDRVTPTVDVPASTCSIVGRFQFMIEGEVGQLEYTVGGQWIASASRNGVFQAVANGTYTVSGGTLTMTGETGSSGGGCQMSDRGVFTMQWSQMCQQLQFGLVMDECEDRGESIARFVLVRQ